MRNNKLKLYDGEDQEEFKRKDVHEGLHVGTYKDIPDSDWPKVARWFQTRI